jgi:hypothetical protein
MDNSEGQHDHEAAQEPPSTTPPSTTPVEVPSFQPDESLIALSVRGRGHLVEAWQLEYGTGSRDDSY